MSMQWKVVVCWIVCGLVIWWPKFEIMWYKVLLLLNVVWKRCLETMGSCGIVPINRPTFDMVFVLLLFFYPKETKKFETSYTP